MILNLYSLTFLLVVLLANENQRKLVPAKLNRIYISFVLCQIKWKWTLSFILPTVTCIIWERNECKKVELTALDIGWAIIETVDKIPESSDYILIGLTFAGLMAMTPFMFLGFHSKDLPSFLSWDIAFGLIDWSVGISWK